MTDDERRAALRAHLDRGLTPRPADYPNDAAVYDWFECDWWRARGAWRDFELAPCVCRGGYNVVPCVGGYRLERCARCNSVEVAVR